MTSSIGTNLELSYEVKIAKRRILYPSGTLIFTMILQNLVDLENVNVCTPKDFVDTLAVAVYGGKEDPELSEL